MKSTSPSHRVEAYSPHLPDAYNSRSVELRIIANLFFRTRGETTPELRKVDVVCYGIHARHVFTDDEGRYRSWKYPTVGRSLVFETGCTEGGCQMCKSFHRILHFNSLSDYQRAW